MCHVLTETISDGALKTELSREANIIQQRKRKRTEEAKVEALNPRNLAKPPAQYAMRVQLIKLIHQQVVRLNDEVKKSSDPFKDALELSEQELITLALNEEERAARGTASVYSNVVKLRITALKKMKREDWEAERKKQIALEYPELSKTTSTPPSPVVIETGLTPKEEIAFLQRLITPQEGLAAHGYVTSVPTLEEIEQARLGVETAKGWEHCDRCTGRFQSFPGRREDGVLTTGGKCTYHPGKARRPAKGKTDQFTCCQSELGSPGCTTAPTHVFKVSSAKRLAHILPFAQTPENDAIKHSAVCFDCEMGYTTYGMELIRLTATSWPTGDVLLDVLVRPLGEILDLNSRFSGVFTEQFTSAPAYTTDSKPSKLSIVNSPAEARSLLFSFISPSTPLIGHALENDLNAVRIVHPTIIDTVMLYPHVKGLPIRHGLKFLVKLHLKKDIQMAGAQGHDSAEDAKAAGKLVRWSVKSKWGKMKTEGWTVDVKDGEVMFIPGSPGR